jgi:tetratricopeptide (TPR) repeat protein
MELTQISSRRASPDQEKTTFGPAWHKRVHGLHVVKLSGSFYEMGRQHGALLSDAMRTGPVPHYRTFASKLLGADQLGPLGPHAFNLVQRTLGGRVGKHLPDFALETVRGLADGSGMSHQEILDGCTMPDSLLWIVSRLIQLKGPGPAVQHRVALSLGCTSAVAWGDATRDGKLLHARNFDYHGVGSWPKSAAVLFHEPEAGHRYVSVSAAGVPLGGVTAMNDAGLSLTVHQHMFTPEVSLGGTPIGVVGDEVMRKAKSLDEAEAILGRHRPNGCWTYIVTDGKTREVLAWEESPKRNVARRSRGDETTFGYANIYLDEELGKTEANLYGSYWRHNQGRHARANELLSKGRGSLDAEAMASILADPGDPRCRVRDSIAMVMTVGSVVFRPEDGVVWVGTGEAPTSHGTFVPFDLHDEDHAPRHGALRPGERQDEKARKAFEHYRLAYVAYVDEGNPEKARAEVDEACALAPREALYHAAAGLLAMAANDPGAALRDFDTALALGHPDEERRAAFHLWRGRARDLTDQRPEAERDYRRALSLRGDPPVHAAARKGLGKAYRSKKLHVDLSLADVVAP